MSNLMQAVRPLAWDFLPTIVFAGLTMVHLHVTTATAAALGVGIAELLIVRARGRDVGLLQWAGLGLALVFGAAGILTKDPRFLMAKPTIIYLALAVVMMKRGWMVEYTPPLRRELAAPLMIGWGYVWAGLMLFTAVANLVVAVWFTAQWPLFMAVFPLASKVTLFAAQYVSIRRTIVARIRAAAQAQVAPLPA